ncbi:MULTISPECIES: MlaD family protein [Chryseobacterium]|uniref:MCE family protein n=1 Tax=Chryseobacterium rhizosphaerae TaxID=395937 RepID=A0AAE4C323_9FLAO|nr:MULTISPECIES: MlaD family protein [Chryseobacterium]MBL3548520.1 MCE family protein [Chryseobacterium sp. KMC2]MDC8102783.1 MlaD family protein [Chryseobacterium rhizosphaerae]MDR6526412.1 phospholipid/cholesterol/gamma-HCH transport system substrate-binding protein [Chryseobacterium rhizosphaerae]MDR6545981.1 phospholipid/cholesterol/gamma-HCH transport system substrate-binding protein [Chryseobacterium rhizosphaerae]REC77679.1 MCE family protein [Chryseobacterium rhizosphaerae]
MKFSKELKAGVITLLAIVGFVVLFQFMKGKSLFTTDNIFYAKYDNVEGLAQSSAVSINGLKVGQVDKIIPQTAKDGKISFIVKITVDNKFEFSKNSMLEIFEPGLMSGKEMRVNLVYGGATAKDGDTLKGAFKLGMMGSLSSQVGPVKDQLQVVLHRVDSLMTNANQIFDAQNRAEIKALLTNLNKTVGALQATAGSVNTLVGHNDPKLQKVLDDASLTMQSGKVTLDKYGNLAQSIDTKQLNATIANLDTTVGKLNQVIGGIDKGEGSLGKLMKDEQLYNNLNSASSNLNSLIEDMKANPKRYINFSVFGKNNKD